MPNIYYLDKIKGTHNIRVVHKNGYAVFRGELTDIKRKLTSNFIYAHRSVIANALNISELDKSNHFLYFENGHKCAYTKNRLKELSKWMRY